MNLIIEVEGVLYMWTHYPGTGCRGNCHLSKHDTGGCSTHEGVHELCQYQRAVERNLGSNTVSHRFRRLE